MGIPGFFRQIEKSHSDVIVPKPPTSIDHLLWDFNSILYNALQHVQQTSTSSWSDICKEILTIVHQEIKNTLETYPPKKTLYIAIDGTTPVQKMAESRIRRNQRYLETIWWPFLQNSNDVWYPMKTNRLPFILESFQKNQNQTFTSLEFTPGSKFYNHLYKDLLKFIPKINKINKIPQIIIDGPFTPGEAEQKFLNWVRNEIPQKSKENIYIISKDADLLVLPFALSPRNFYILREIDAENTEKYQQLWGFQDIPEYAVVRLPDLYGRYLRTLEGTPSLFFDQLALTFFQGNDFVKPIWYLPSFWNQSEGIIRQTYDKIRKNNELLVGFDEKQERWTFSLAMLQQFFETLSQYEVKHTNEFSSYLLQQGRKTQNREESPFFSQWISHLPFTHPAHPWRDLIVPLLEKIRKSAYKYPLPYWSFEDSKVIQREIHPSHPEMPSVITYLQSLQWTLEYYMNQGTKSWQSFFEQPVSPFPSQISAELGRIMKENSGKKWLLEILPEIGENAPLHPLENFVAVLPALPNFKGENYLPKSLHKDWDDYISNIPFADIVMPKDPKIAPCDVATGHKWVNKNLWLHLPEWNWKERVRLVQKHLSQQDVKERNQTLEPTKFLAGK